ncbi:MAG: hypothetical protein K0V04_40625 [Deltaproteobacteria bacterium]|nr:hypothetical protein [Deltaproteobacteria bacterium]
MNDRNVSVTLAVVLLSGVAGCPSETGVSELPKEEGESAGSEGTTGSGEESGEEECVSEIVDVECVGQATCDQAVDLSQVVMDCYWDEGQGAWSANTPPEIADQCDPAFPCSVILATEQPLHLLETCTGGCIDLCDRPPEDCCHWSMPSVYYSPLVVYWDDVYHPFVDQVHADCETNGLFDVSLDYCPPETRVEPAPEIVECSLGAPIAPPNDANLMLTIDPTASFVGMSGEGASLETGMSGSCAARTEPVELLSGLFWVDDTSLGDLAIEDWSFFFSTPITPTMGTNAFEIQVAQVAQASIMGHGFVDSTPYQAQVLLAEPAAGTLNLETNTWSLHYEQHLPTGSSITVHLQGPVTHLEN